MLRQFDAEANNSEESSGSLLWFARRKSESMVPLPMARSYSDWLKLERPLLNGNSPNCNDHLESLEPFVVCLELYAIDTSMLTSLSG